jgi:hypothetical protein
VKPVHLVGLTIGLDYDARTYERQKLIFGVYLVLGGKVHLVILSLSLSPREVQNLAAFVNNLHSLTV